MDRLEQLVHYYTKCRRGVVLQRWKELCDSEEGNAVELVCRFHSLLLADLQEQTKWYSTVFHQPLSNSSRILLPVYAQALSTLDPSPLQPIESLLKKPAAQEGIYMLQQLKSSIDGLVYGMEAHLKDVGAVDDMFAGFCETLYQLLRSLVSNRYKPLCIQYLTEQFASSVEENGDMAESIHNLKQSHSKINSMMESTISSCMTLTQGCGMQLLIQVRRFAIFKCFHLCSDVDFVSFLFDRRLGTNF